MVFLGYKWVGVIEWIVDLWDVLWEIVIEKRFIYWNEVIFIVYYLFICM